MLSPDFNGLIDLRQGVYNGIMMAKSFTNTSRYFKAKLNDTITHAMKLDDCTEQIARLRTEPSLACEWALAEYINDSYWIQRDASEGSHNYSFDVLNLETGVRIEVKVLSAKAADRQVSIWDNALNPTRPLYKEPRRNVGVVRVGTFLKPESRADVIMIFDNESNDTHWLFKPRCVITKKGLLNGLGDIREGIPGIMSKGDGAYLNGDPKEQKILVPENFKEDIFYHGKEIVYY
ncbi:DenB-like DNA endonuclease IV [Serratia phage 92A1]|nr:DenB-like DNA endonuclease IV [Serratia phage 92A1]